MKPLDLIISLRDKLEENWIPQLRDINIWEDVQEIYLTFPGDFRKANSILSYIIYTYSKNSMWLDLHMDITENKARIMTSIAGISYQTDVDYVSAITGNRDPYHKIIEWYLDYQKDKRWKTIISGFEYHAKAQVISKMSYSAKDMADAGRMLEHADKRLDKANELLDTLRSENVKIDDHLKKDGRVPLSERLEDLGFDFMSHEAALLKKINQNNSMNPESEGNGVPMIGETWENSYEDDEQY